MTEEIIDDVEIAETKKPVFKLPYQVTCSKCGAKKAVRHEVLLKRLAKYEGTLEERFNANQAEYLCQSCRAEKRNAEIEAKLAAKA